jgi:hypothetical protein
MLAITTSAWTVQTVPTGTWKAVFVGPLGQRPKMFNEVVFDLQANGNNLTGTALMGSWPGLAPISDGVIDGDHFSFTAVGKLRSSSGYPKMGFDGRIHGDEMTLIMTWSYVGDNDPAAPKLEMHGTRMSR